MSEYALAEGVELDLYGRSECSDCDAAKKVIDDVRVPYTYKDVLKDEDAQSQVARVCAAFERDPAVPVIIIHHQTADVNGEIVFIEPRGLGLQALANTLLAFRVTSQVLSPV